VVSDIPAGDGKTTNLLFPARESMDFGQEPFLQCTALMPSDGCSFTALSHTIVMDVLLLLSVVPL
jgi:hypothetical protein